MRDALSILPAACIEYITSCIAVVLSVLEGTATFALSQRVLYFCNKVRAGVVLLNIVVKRCTSSDVESKSLFKAGAYAHAGARKF